MNSFHKNHAIKEEKLSFQKRLLFFFFPQKCLSCGEMGYSPLCPACEKALSDAFSPQKFLADGGNGFADSMTALFSYDIRVAKKLILLWKSLDHRDLPLAFLPYIHKWNKKTKIKSPIVTFVPRRQEAKRKNGFDQAESLAEFIAKSLECPFETLLFRRGFSKKQHNLPREQRKKNVAGVFHPKRKMYGETVLLIDDIVTSGASVKECARTLKKAGAQKVFVLTLTH